MSEANHIANPDLRSREIDFTSLRQEESVAISQPIVTEQTEVWLPPTAKVKLVRQVLMQKERGFFSDAM